MKRALVIGGSVGGLFAAHLLRSIGWDVLVFERNTGDLAGRGVGIGTQDVLHDVMQRVGLRDDATMAVDTKSCACIGDDGRVLHEIRLRRVTSAWARFYRPLKDALPDANYRPGWRLERVDQVGDDRVTAMFANGETVSGDLLVGADGIRSTVRAQMLPDVQPVYSGYIGWRSLIAEAELPAALREAVFDRYTFVLPPNELVVAYPVPALDGGTTPGRRAYNIVWYRPADRDALAELCTDAAGQRHDSIPPPLIRPEVIASMKADAARRLPSLIADILKLVPRPFFHPISDMLSPKLVFGRVALLGDAAFLPRPHGGSGVTKASLDAAALADALTDAETDSGLARYEERQLRLGEWIVQRGRELGAYVNVRKDRRPDALVREYNATNADLNTFLAAQRSRVRS